MSKRHVYQLSLKSITYAHDRSHQWRRAAYFVDKIIRGAKPANLPVDQIEFSGLLNASLNGILFGDRATNCKESSRINLKTRVGV
jgi:hypothetical protein